MARITLTPRFDALDDWPGRLLEADDTTTILTRTATSFVAVHGAGSEFEGFRVVATGTGFSYIDGDPVAGNISSLRILNAAGQTVLTIANIPAGTFAADFANFFYNMFGGQSGEGSDPNGKTAWSHILSGNDVINGTAGDDRRGLVGLDAGNDRYNMGRGDDWVNGGIGNDSIYGGDGYDTLSYQQTAFNEGATAFRGITANMVTGVVLDPWGGTDRIFSVEEIRGSRFNDLFIGNNDRNEFRGGAGRDTIDGGANSFNGTTRTEDRRDRVTYSDDYWDGGRFGIVANLETSFAGGSVRGTVRDGFGNIDTVIDIERVSGTRYNDVMNGSRMDNQFAGGEGRDSYNGRAGFDTIIFDWWFGDTTPGGIVVNLGLASGQIIDDGFGNTENAVSIEAIYGSDGNDSIRGNGAGNQFEGNNGADTMAGAGGSDVFVWTDQSELDEGDRVLDFTATGPAADRLAFLYADFAGMTATVRLVNGANATIAAGQFVFNAANDTLYWDRDGTGAAAAEVVAVLENVNALTVANIEMWT